MSSATRQRRTPVPRGAFRAAGRQAAARRAGRFLALPARIVAAGILAFAVLFVAARVTAAALTGFESLTRDVSAALPQRQATTALILPEVASGAASAEPIFQDLPSFTAQERLLVIGRVPLFAIEAGRQVELVLNGNVLGRFAFDQAGRFGTELTLRDGPNAIVARLMTERGEQVATTSATVVLDKAAPPLTFSRPRAGEEIEGSSVTVTGKTAPRVSVRVNGRTIAPNPDGTFSETVPAQPGAMAIVVIARNEAGVETTARIPVTVRQATPLAAQLQVGVGLDVVRVRPGGPVNARIVLTNSSRQPVSGVTATLSVGVVEIGSAQTSAAGIASIPFAAPDTEGEIAVVVLAGGASGRATLIVSKTAPPS